jgi:DNA helicase HerA-like ATPase
VVCEEAHRYIPTDQTAGFAPTRSAIARIAKEGRKYGVYLSIVSQRPGELDETILSQCNTFFSMRLGNERDQEIMRKAIAGSSRSAINFLPSLANREAIAFGQGVSTPMRMMFEKVEPNAARQPPL